MSFTFLDIILFAGISQGLFLVSSIKLLANRNQKANDILALTIGFAVLMLLGRILVFKINDRRVEWIAVLVDTTIFLFGPLLFFYIKNLLFKGVKNDKSYLHFLMAAAHLVYAIVVITFSILYNKIPSDYVIVGWTGSIVETLGLLSLLTYTIRVFLLLRNHKKVSKYEISYELKVRHFLNIIIWILISFTALWCISYISSYFFKSYIPLLNYTSLWVSIPIFIYTIGYFNLRQPEIFKMPIIPISSKEKPRLKPEEIKHLQKRLHYFMIEESLFKTSDLSLKILAEKINTTPNNLSWLLNQVYQQSFYDYINELRIKDVIESIDKELHVKQTLISLAYDAGFNSKSTFNKVFKNITAQTPSQYIKNKKIA